MKKTKNKNKRVMKTKNIFKGFVYGLLIFGLIFGLSGSISAYCPACGETITTDITLTCDLTNCSRGFI